MAEKTSPSTGRDVETRTTRWSFTLVLVMLGVLTVLIIVTVLLPKCWHPTGDTKTADVIEFSKWVVTALLAAFGAWIGAGVAHFFGKQSLVESSRSTEAALKLQAETFGRKLGDRVKDMPLTALNPNFLFHPQSEKEEVLSKLKTKFRGYWFVPILEPTTGELVDVLHTQVLWGTDWEKELNGPTALETIIGAIDKDDRYGELRPLHGGLFFIRIGLNDKLADVLKQFNSTGAEVAVVVDENGKPSYCVSKNDVQGVLSFLGR